MINYVKKLGVKIIFRVINRVKIIIMRGETHVS